LDFYFRDTYTEQAEFYKQTLVAATHQGSEVYDETLRYLILNDLWFMMTFALGRTDMVQRPEINPQWLYERCVEVQLNPDEHLDLWSRDHYKTTIISYGKTIQDILNDPEITFGIFSITKKHAQDILKMIKDTFEENELLKRLFPEILYKDPQRQSPCWGIVSGLRVKRTSIRREETISAYGLISGLPTGSHFDKMVYDDVVTEKSVTNLDQLTKAFDQMRLSFSCGKSGGVRRFIGTRYHYNDAWGDVIKNKIAKQRIHPATVNGEIGGQPVFLAKEILDKKYIDMGPYIYGCQMLQNPEADKAMSFKQEWLRYYDRPLKVPRNWNVYITVDPASKPEKVGGKQPDYTVMLVIGLAPDGNYYLVDGFRKRINLVERCNNLIRLHRKWKPIAVGYEEYGIQADIEHIKEEMERINYRFPIMPLGGRMSKGNRIRRLVPAFSRGKFYIPYRLLFMDENKKTKNLTELFIEEEYLPFPVSLYYDIFDAMARILDKMLGATFPETPTESRSATSTINVKPYDPMRYSRRGRR